MLKPSDVFTPARPPVDDTNVYSARGESETSLAKALERNMIPVIFGEYGVGKTTLARRASLAAERAGCLVNIESVDGKTLSDILMRCLEHAGYAVMRSTQTERQQESSTTQGGEAGVDFAPFKAGLKAERTAKSAQATREDWELVVTSPSDSKVLDTCETLEIFLIIDEMHRATPELLKQLSSFIKAYHNKPCKKFKIALVGTTSDASRLALRDPGIDRIIQEILLGAMTQGEAEFLVRSGMSALAVEISDQLITRVAKAAVGSPSIAQYLALEVAEAAFARTPRKATPSDLENAVHSYMVKRAARLNETYMKAIETTGAKRYRKQILRAMSEVKNEFVTMDELVRGVSTLLGEETPSTALSGPLRDLKSPDYGNVLKDVERTEGDGQRVYNLNTFTDPAMKAFIRMRTALDAEAS